MIKDIFKDEFQKRPLFYYCFRKVEVFQSSKRIFKYENGINYPVGMIEGNLSNHLFV